MRKFKNKNDTNFCEKIVEQCYLLIRSLDNGICFISPYLVQVTQFLITLEMRKIQ